MSAPGAGRDRPADAMPDTSDPGPSPVAEDRDDELDGSSSGVPDAARAVLSRVRSAARAGGAASTDARPTRPSATRRRRRLVAGFSGPGPDERDPLAIGGAWSRLVEEQGWRRGLDVARLLGMWAEIVGAANAEHATPESFDPESGVLLIRTSSTAWAEQLRLMMPALRTAIEAQVGPGVVRDIRVVGPTPPRTRGRLRVRGRGPRDTYG
jgi:predicted nucleic acid-binding Zn ribbon protein